MANDNAPGDTSGARTTGTRGREAAPAAALRSSRDDRDAAGDVAVSDTAMAAGDTAMAAGDTAMAAGDTAMAATAPPSGTGPSPGSAPDDTLIGTILLERYEITRKIGQGGMGAVYEARNTRIGKRVAVKVLLEKYAHKDQVVQRLEQEARLASSIGHEHIIDITDRGETHDGRMFVVMEFLEGESLGACIQREGQLVEQRAVKIAHQAASALHAAHEKGILHRDVKPENVFLLKRKGEDFVKVVDFGISKSLHEEDGANSPRLTQTGMVLGTPLYMSPEQARGAENLDRRTDVYSLGVIVYEMITGEVPFRGNNYLNIIARVLNDDPRPPHELRPDISPELEAVILRALEKDPDDRYASCEDMAADLATLIHDTGRTTGRSHITAPRYRRKRDRRSRLAILAWVGGIGGVSGAVVATVALLMAGKPVPAPEPPEIHAITPLPPPDAGAPTPDAAAAPAVRIAAIEIASEPPGATIYAGGRVIGTTPFVHHAPRENQQIELIAELDGHNDVSFTINPLVDDGKPVQIRLKKPASGAVRKLRKTPAPDKVQPEPSGRDPKSDPGGSGTAGGELQGNPYRPRDR